MLHSKKLLLLMYMLGFSVSLLAQITDGKVTGKVLDHNQQPATGATITLHRMKDSVLVKSAVSSKTGEFTIANIKEGQFFLRIEAVGYGRKHTPSFTINADSRNKELGVLQVEPVTSQLKDVMVTARKPFIENQIDKVVVNVESSIVSAGSSALDILERSPGIMVNNNDAISMSGRQGLIVMIDGKPTPMSGSDLANMLRGMPASSIEKIELITNPSAKYDASGNAGMINIKLKKDQRLGTNGSYNLNYGQGIYPKGGGGISFNHRNKKVNYFGNYNYTYLDNFSHLTLFRQFFTTAKVFDGAYDGNNFVRNDQRSHSYRAGFDYTASKRTIIGMVATGLNNTVLRSGNNYSAVIDKNSQMVSSFSTRSRSRGGWDNIAINANLKTTLDSLGQELTMDADYATYVNDVNQDIITGFADPAGMPISAPFILKGLTDGKLTIRAFRTDYSKPLKKGARFEAGIKTSLVTADNQPLFYDRSGGGNILDSGRSNHFIYDENINAGYLNYSKQFKGFSIQLGLRAEQTNIKGTQLFNGRSFDSTYFQLFPTIFLQKSLSENHSLGLSIGRRIDRPSYNQLNPFVFFIDPSTYQTGNPYLRPQSTYNVQLNYMLKKKYLFSFTYANTSQVMSQVLMPDPANNRVTINTDVNLTSLDYYALNISAPFRIASWWNSINNFNGFYGYYRGNLAGTSLSNGIPAYTMNTNNSFTLKKGWSAEVTGFYMSRHRMGFMELKPFGQLGLGVQKTVLQNKGALRLNITDVLYTGYIRANSAYDSFQERFRVPRDTRVIRLSFSYRFGKNSVAPSRRRGTGSDEERQRVNTTN